MVGLSYYKFLNTTRRLLLLYLGVCLLMDLSSRALHGLFENNLILFSISGLIDLLIFSKLYHQFSKRKYLIGLMALLGSMYILIEFIYLDVNQRTSFQPYAKVVASFFIVSMALNYFFEQINKEQKIARLDLYLNSFVLCFFALELILLLPTNFLINGDHNIIFAFWFLRILFLLLFYSGLTFLIWKNGKNQKQLRYG